MVRLSPAWNNLPCCSRFFLNVLTFLYLWSLKNSQYLTSLFWRYKSTSTLFMEYLALLSTSRKSSRLRRLSGQPSPVHFVHSPSSTCVLLILLCNIRKTLVKHSPFINCYFFYSLYDTGCKKEPFKSTN